MRTDNRRSFRPGQVVYVHHLHTRPDLVRHDPQRDSDGRTWGLVEGKARPMLVLRECWRLVIDTATRTGERSGTNTCEWYRVETRPGYWVLSLTSRKPPPPYQYHRNLIESGKDSYVSLVPVCYPAESVCHGEHQHAPSVDGHVLGMIEKEISLAELGLCYRA